MYIGREGERGKQEIKGRNRERERQSEMKHTISRPHIYHNMTLNFTQHDGEIGPLKMKRTTTTTYPTRATAWGHSKMKHTTCNCIHSHSPLTTHFTQMSHSIHTHTHTHTHTLNFEVTQGHSKMKPPHHVYTTCIYSRSHTASPDIAHRTQPYLS